MHHNHQEPLESLQGHAESGNNSIDGAESTSQIPQFFDTVFPDLRGLWLLIWLRQSKTSHWFNCITDEVIAAILNWAQTEDVYVGCGLAPSNCGPHARCPAHKIAAIPGLWLDVDYGLGHKKHNLPRSQEDAMTLIESMELAPTMVIHSGHGLQAWWVFKELWVFDSDEDRKRAQCLTHRWNQTLMAKARKKGWTADNVGDLARVMRIPGTWNRKPVG